MDTSILPRCLYKGGVLFDVPRFEEVSSQVFPHLSHEHTSIDNLLHLLRPVIEKKINNYRESISAEEQLVITLR